MKTILNVKYDNGMTDIEFPCSEKTLRESLESLGVPDVCPPKLYVTETVTPDGLQMLEGKEQNLDEINYLAKLLEGLITEEKEKIYAVAEYEGYDTPKDLINVYFNPGCYTLIQSIKNIESVGRQYYEGIDGTEEQKETEKTDYAKIGKDLLASDKGVFTKRGLLLRNEQVAFQEVYDGKVFPFYSYTGDELCSVKAEYGGRCEYLYLPTEPQAIQKALKRLGTEKAEDCRYELIDFNADNKTWAARFEEMLKKESIFDVNAAVEKINVADIDFDKLEGMIKYAGDESAKTIAKLAEHIDDFEYIDGAMNYTDVGQYAVDITFGADIPSELEKYIDRYGVGRHMEEEYAGKFVDGGFVYINSHTTLEELLGIPPENEMCEQQKM